VKPSGELSYLGETIKMAELANDAVWQFSVDIDEFEKMRKELWIVHHIKVKDRIRIRCLSGSKPRADAVSVKPSLEDAYLWLLRDKNAE